MKRLAILVPVNDPHLGKSRLAGVLAPQDRIELNHLLFRQTIDQLAELADFACVHVVSKSIEILRAAAKRGFTVCAEPEDAGLNEGLFLGLMQARAAGSTVVMVVPIDLPLMKSEHLRCLVSRGEDADVTIITDRAGMGTNVMLWRPIETAVFCYGESSAARHKRIGINLGLRVVTRQEPCLSFDLDTAQDWEVWAGLLAPEKHSIQLEFAGASRNL